MDFTLGVSRAGRAAILGMALLSGCQSNPLDALRRGDAAGPDTVGPAATARVVERDVEAPEVFRATDRGLWDGRPSLGGVWVAHPDATEPERVIIRNEDNTQFVIGALFRRERDNPGPVIQVSSDAAEALGMLAGAPATLNVTALRRQEVEDVAEDAVAPPDAAGPVDLAAETVETTALDAPTRDIATPAPSAPSSLDRPFVQIGIFSVAANAEDTAADLRDAGLVPLVREQTTAGKTFFRVVVGPSGSIDDRATVLAKVKEMGFEDAYFVAG